MKRAKILFLSNRNPYPVVDGQSRRTYNILKGLSLDFDVYFLCLFEPQEEVNINDANLMACCSKVEFLPCPSKKLSFPMIIRLVRSLFSKFPYTVWRHHSNVFVKRVETILCEEQFDLIHCDCLPLANVLISKSNIQTVLTDHDVSYLKYYRIAELNTNVLVKYFYYLESLKVKLFEKNVFRKYDLVVAVSEFDKQLLSKLCNDVNIAVVENGVDLEEFDVKLNGHDKYTLIWFGGFKHYPNFEAIHYFLNEIYFRIKEKVTEVKLIVVGGDVPYKLKKFSEKDDSIKFVGFVEGVVPYLRRANVLISPILSGSGTRLKILEGMATGKAIVSTSIGVEGIGGVNGKHYIISDSPQEFADNVTSILHNKDREKELGENARMLVKEKYDWSIIWKKNKLLYEELIK